MSQCVPSVTKCNLIPVRLAWDSVKPQGYYWHVNCTGGNFTLSIDDKIVNIIYRFEYSQSIIQSGQYSLQFLIYFQNSKMHYKLITATTSFVLFICYIIDVYMWHTKRIMTCKKYLFSIGQSTTLRCPYSNQGSALLLFIIKRERREVSWIEQILQRTVRIFIHGNEQRDKKFDVLQSQIWPK